MGGIGSVGLSFARLVYLAFTLCCIVLAFMPQANAARWLDLCVAPARVLGEVASPLRWLARRDALAAELELVDSVLAESEESRELGQEERYFAMPDEERLISNRRFVHAQVVRRFADAPDRIECALEEDAAQSIEAEMPVVLSNSYVGRVHSIDALQRRIIVYLVTDKNFRVGARADGIDANDPGTALVVGGLVATKSAATLLAVHNPEHALVANATIRVDEEFNKHARHGELSKGFRLGALKREAPDRFAIAPEIDFANGLFRVVVVLPAQASPETKPIELNVFDDENWRAVFAYGACEPAPWREGLKINFSRRSGARESSAVIAGPRLVGFISHAGTLQSDVALLGDRGVSVPTQARVEGEVAPLVLGRLIGLGRKYRGGPARFQWSPVNPLAPAANGASMRPARLFTGAGELGVPRGLLIGDTILPCGLGTFEIEVSERVDARLLRELWVWRGIEREEKRAARAP